MNYYEIISGNLIVGVVNDSDMRKYQHKHNIILICESDEAQYAQYNDILYHDEWMLPVSDDVPYVLAQIKEISSNRYEELLEQLSIETEVTITIEPEPSEDDSYQNTDDEQTEINDTRLKTVAQQLQEQINELTSQLALATRYAKL